MQESRRLHRLFPEDFTTQLRVRELGLISDLVKRDHGRILDVGCGNGLIQQFLPPETYYVGSDFTREYLTALWKGRAQGNRVVGEATRLPFGRGIFDVVLALHIVEHLDQLRQRSLVLELYRVLKKGGKLTISTPNAGTWFNAHKFSPPYNPKHLHCLTYSELHKLLLDADFSQVERFSFDVIVDYPIKIFRCIPYSFRRNVAGLIPSLDKHIILRATRGRNPHKSEQGGF